MIFVIILEKTIYIFYYIKSTCFNIYFLNGNAMRISLHYTNRANRIILPVILISFLFFTHCGPAIVELSETFPPDYGKRAIGKNGMVVSAHPLASKIGLEVLRDGGNAIDAAIAVAYALSVVEPMMGGLGGSGSMLIWRQNGSQTDYLDFYARSPMNPDTNVLNYTYDDMSPLGAAIPGTVAGLSEAHDRFGVLPYERLVKPAIALAESGFPVHGLLSRVVQGDSTKLNLYERPAELFWPDGNPIQAGEILKQPELASTLRLISEHGRNGFYKGIVAKEIIEVLNKLGNPMTFEDLEHFKPKWKRPVCGVYRGHVVLSAPPPQSGFQIVQTLNLLESFDISTLELPTRSYQSLHLLASALRLSTADRIQFLGDPDFHPVPVDQIISNEYALKRRQEFDPDTVIQGQRAGVPESIEHPTIHDKCNQLDPYQTGLSDIDFDIHAENRGHWNDLFAEESESQTTHISVIDSDGNAVSLTFTVGVYFGSGVWAAGTFFNSSQHIFSGDPESPNALGPGRTPRSTTTPTIILSDGRARLIAGAAGGNRIPTSVIQNIIYIIDYSMDPIDAIRMPRFFPFASSTVLHLEHGFAGDVFHMARINGYHPESRDPFDLYFGGVHLIEQKNNKYIGVADPRRDGEARGY